MDSEHIKAIRDLKMITSEVTTDTVFLKSEINTESLTHTCTHRQKDR